MANPVLAILIWPIWANPFLANPIWANPFWGLVCVTVGPKGGPEGCKISRFFFSFPALMFVLFVSLSLWVFFRGILVVFEAPGPSNVHNQRAQTCTFQGPGPQKHHQKVNEKTPEREKKNEMGVGEGKKSEILGGPASVGRVQTNHNHNHNHNHNNNNNHNNKIWGGSVLTGEGPSPHSGELKHALPQAGGPTQSQLSRHTSSGHHISMEHRLRRKQLNSDTNASKKKYLKEIQEKEKNKLFLRKK